MRVDEMGELQSPSIRPESSLHCKLGRSARESIALQMPRRSAKALESFQQIRLTLNTLQNHLVGYIERNDTVELVVVLGE